MTAGPLAGGGLALLSAGVAFGVRHALHVRMEAVARACHELRGPLTAVRLGLALSAADGELSATRLDALETELGRATLALDDLTLAGRRAAPPFALERVSLRRVLGAAVTAAEGRAVAADATVAGGWEGVDAVLWGDRLRLAQAIGNLVANAVEHGGGEIHVRGTLRDGWARVAIDDDGPGLPAPVPVLADRPRAGRGARGRGLAIALAIARAHGGTVAAAPTSRGGRVVVRLPARAARDA